MRGTTAEGRITLLYARLAPEVLARTGTTGGFRDSDLQVSAQAFRRALVESRRGRVKEAEAWLRTALLVVRERAADGGT